MVLVRGAFLNGCATVLARLPALPLGLAELVLALDSPFRFAIPLILCIVVFDFSDTPVDSCERRLVRIANPQRRVEQ